MCIALLLSDMLNAYPWRTGLTDESLNNVKLTESKCITKDRNKERSLFLQTMHPRTKFDPSVAKCEKIGRQ